VIDVADDVVVAVGCMKRLLGQAKTSSSGERERERGGCE
jgi:hypothetical protein